MEGLETFQNFSKLFTRSRAEDRPARGGASGETGAASTHSSCLPIRVIIGTGRDPQHYPEDEKAVGWLQIGFEFVFNILLGVSQVPRDSPRKPLTEPIRGVIEDVVERLSCLFSCLFVASSFCYGPTV